nr:unnamed protein product [Callosobruchus chinensis]CAH7736365.1 unnamed protein product [Callosobruchus chinensis]
MFGLRASIYRRTKIIVGHLQKIFENCPPSSKTKSSTVCFTFAGHFLDDSILYFYILQFKASIGFHAHVLSTI